ncbi:MAG: acyl-CoA thioesterase [Phycisphaerales bacterium]|nr:acyl-CoA thioesterase [Phycisphaerales bacterium]
MPHVHRLDIRVRYCECDPMGVVHHAVYPIWLEMGRTELLRTASTNYASLEAAGIFLVVTRLNIRYRKPARYDEVLTLETTLADMGHVKIEHTYRLWCGADELAVAETTLACVDRQGVVRALPPQVGTRERTK